MLFDNHLFSFFTAPHPNFLLHAYLIFYQPLYDGLKALSKLSYYPIVTSFGKLKDKVRTALIKAGYDRRSASRVLLTEMKQLPRIAPAKVKVKATKMMFGTKDPKIKFCLQSTSTKVRI